jgi:hypothetical protein
MMGLSITTRLGGQFEKKVLNSGSEEEGSLGTKVLSCSKVVESVGFGLTSRFFLYFSYSRIPRFLIKCLGNSLIKEILTISIQDISGIDFFLNFPFKFSRVKCIPKYANE